MSDVRHRQTPLPKHDQKTRHVGLAHVAQSSYLALVLLWRSFTSSGNTLLRTLLGAFRACPTPRRERRSRGDRPTVVPRFCLTSLGDTARSASGPYQLVATSATLPWFRAGGGYSVPLFAAQSRHEKPYPPISKIKCRLAFERQDGNSMPHSPA